MNVVIRAATVDDVAMISEFNCCLAMETENKTLDQETVAKGVRGGLSQGDEVQYFVAEVENQLIGQIMLTREWSDWRNGWMIWLQSVYVIRERRGEGVFRKLFESSMEFARIRFNPVCVRLYVEHDNIDAVETYRRLGFQQTGYHVMEMPMNS